MANSVFVSLLEQRMKILVIIFSYVKFWDIVHLSQYKEHNIQYVLITVSQDLADKQVRWRAEDRISILLIFQTS